LGSEERLESPGEIDIHNQGHDYIQQSGPDLD
jgi:hypothetical protein